MIQMFGVIALSLGFLGPPDAADPMTLLQRLQGDWFLTFLQIDENGAYQKVGSSFSKVEVKLGGKLVQEETVIKTARREFPLVVQYSYDFARKVYRKTSTDGVTGLMDIQEGQLADGILQLSNVHRRTWFIGESGQEFGFRVTLDLNKANEMVLIADLSRDEGKTWMKFQKVLYTRIEPPTPVNR